MWKLAIITPVGRIIVGRAPSRTLIKTMAHNIGEDSITHYERSRKHGFKVAFINPRGAIQETYI